MPYDFITSRGVIVPDLADTRALVEQEWKAAFGDDLDTSPETPQGVIITMLTEARDNVARNNAELANQINPDIAGGIYLDALMALMGGSRFSATKSIITGATLAGVPGTIIPAGSLAATDDGQQFRLTLTKIIGPDGTTTGDFEALDFGPIEVAPHGLTRLASSVLGWETVDNDSAAIVGRNEESDVRARSRRTDILGIQSIGQNESIISAVRSLPTVQSLSFRENYTDSPIVIDGVTLKPHSIYMAIDGGIDVEIAKALKRTKSLGAGYNGSVSVVIEDEITGQPYTVQFDRPDEINLFVRVTVKLSSSNAQEVVPNAVMMMVAGDIEGDPGLTVGRDVSPFEISAAVNFVDPTIFVRKVELSTDGATWSTVTQEIKINEVARIARPSVTVIVV